MMFEYPTYVWMHVAQVKDLQWFIAFPQLLDYIFLILGSHTNKFQLNAFNLSITVKSMLVI